VLVTVALARGPKSSSQVYATLLVVLGLVFSGRVSDLLSPHATITLLFVVGCYAYRDVWPSTTYTMVPQDAQDGAWLWVKVGLAVLAGIVLPSLKPYPYIPVDAKVRLS
jgi:hypothetical protein